ncbi:salicylate synthetase [Aspergillus arachidicola]|uniref:Salicylate synthetase n=1 Tax=Aspergillus arachidicola TaxID=656916 RepID=A0A2G7FI20_9EURO|nr:salicylate synthetase [Aspergillus arachidicola]
MTVLPTSITLRHGPPDALQRVATVLSKVKSDDYHAYERTSAWYLGIGNRSSVTIDPEGRKATFPTNGKDEVRYIDGEVTDLVREYISANEDGGTRIYGYVGFSYAILLRGIRYTAGEWPMLSLMVPRTEVVFYPDRITLAGVDKQHPRELYSGAILLIEDPETWDAALVLRTVFQGLEKQCIQAGAVIVAQSSPGRELTETSEKLANVAPYVVAERNQKG